MSDDPRDTAAGAAQGHLAEILAMALIERGLIDPDDLCNELDDLARARRSEGQNDAMAARIASLAVSLRAVTPSSGDA